MGFLEVANRYAGVDLRRIERGVSQDLLHMPERSPVPQKMGRERVAQHVRGHAFVSPGAPRCEPYPLIDRGSLHPSPVVRAARPEPKLGRLPPLCERDWRKARERLTRTDRLPTRPASGGWKTRQV